SLRFASPHNSNYAGYWISISSSSDTLSFLRVHIMVAFNKGRKFPAEPLTADEVKRLINACSRRAPTGIRNRALLVVLYRAGLRVSEALGLMPKDCNIEAGSLRVLKGKGQTARTVGLDAGAFLVLQLWLERRKQLGLDGRSPVFCTLHGEPLQTAYVRAMVRR